MTSEDAKKAILKLFQCFNSTGSDTERKIKFTAYWEVLSDLPPETILAVCRRAARGEIGSPGFLPTAAELFQAACPASRRGPQYPLLNEPQRHISQAERAMVLRGFKELNSELALNKAQQSVAGWQSLGEAATQPLREWNRD